MPDHINRFGDSPRNVGCRREIIVVEPDEDTPDEVSANGRSRSRAQCAWSTGVRPMASGPLTELLAIGGIGGPMAEFRRPAISTQRAVFGIIVRKGRSGGGRRTPSTADSADWSSHPILPHTRLRPHLNQTQPVRLRSVHGKMICRRMTLFGLPSEETWEFLPFNEHVCNSSHELTTFTSHRQQTILVGSEGCPPGGLTEAVLTRRSTGIQPQDRPYGLLQ